MRALAVSCTDETLLGDATTLADRLQLPLAGICHEPRLVHEWLHLLMLDEKSLQIVTTGKKAPGPVWVDFSSSRLRHRRKGGGELLVRACGVKPDFRPQVLDATAGLGTDGFILADHGCHVTLCEREPLVAALLSDGIARAQAHEDSEVRLSAERLDFVLADAADLLGSAQSAMFDVVYLDPMFAEQEKSARSRKEMNLLQTLLPSALAQSSLVNLARRVARKRVVVKRGLKAPPLDGCRADYMLKGRAIRFDVYNPRPVSD